MRNVMLNKNNSLDVEILCEYISYNHETGELTYIKKPSRKILSGSTVGCPDKNGYIQFRFMAHNLLAHRVAWAIYYGKWPEKQIDHINHIKSDNRINNLRQADHSQNGCNRGLQSNNRSGVPGVHWSSQKEKWFAKIKLNGKSKHLGVFADIEDAANAVKKARIEMHGDFAFTC